MRITVKKSNGNWKIHVNPRYIIAAGDDTRMVFIEGQQPFRVTKKSYEKVVRYLDGVKR